MPHNDSLSTGQPVSTFKKHRVTKRRVSAFRIAALLALLAVPLGNHAVGEEVHLNIDSPLPPPGWALMQRQLLDANGEACRIFFDRYFDDRGYLLCVERWGGDDGPDDAIENCNDWPILHALGGPEDVLSMYKKAWEGHLRQYTLAKTTDVPFARDGMYYKEFPVTFDWVHNGEGLTVFNLQGLSDPKNRAFQRRVKRYAGFYLNEDPGAQNYDPEHKIIRSLFNGSRGPLLRKATALDWAGDPIEVKNRFRLGHGEESYEQMLAHFQDYNDIVGDHPQNLLATSLALNAYMLTGEAKYREWLLEYVDAWGKRMADNGYIIPTNIGLDGRIGGETDGKWYGGVYGWAFSVKVPQTGGMAHRNTHYLGFTGFMNAYLLTGDDRYLDPWRRQIVKINAQRKTINGKQVTPRMYGDEGWYAYTPGRYTAGAADLHYLSLREDDRERAPANPWFDYLRGRNPNFPIAAMQADFARIRQRVQGIRDDTTTPDTRLADDPMRLNPASVHSLIPLMLGGIHPKHQGSVLHCRLRYFDPERRRAGPPEDVAALVERMDDRSLQCLLVNTSPTQARTVRVQAGGYGEHQFVGLKRASGDVRIDDNILTITLEPGCGERLTFQMRRYVNQPRFRAY